MPQRVRDVDEPDEPGRPAREVTIYITVPEKFLAAAIDRLNELGGCATAIDSKQNDIAISGSLPASEYEELRESIPQAVLGRGRVELG